MTRYRWATQFVAGRRVLEVGLEVGDGHQLLVEAGAREVVRVNLASAGDIPTLPHGDAEFGVAVCFDVMGYVDEPSQLVAELDRVLRLDGLLAISIPNPDANMRGAGDHVRPLTRIEVANALSERLEHVWMFRQETYRSSVIVPESGPPGEEQVCAPALAFTPPEGPPAYLLAVASRVPLPEPAPALGLTSHMTDELAHKLQDRRELQARLLDVEQRLATAASLKQRNADLQEEVKTGDESWQEDLAAHRREIEVLSWRLASAERTLQEVVSSISWRATKPLRKLKRVRRT